LRFEAKNGRSLDDRDIYLRDERDQVTDQPSTVVVCSAVVFGHCRLLEEVGELWDFPLRHFCGATSWRRRGYHHGAFHPRVMSRVICVGQRNNGSSRGINSDVSHEAVNGEGNGRLEGKSEKQRNAMNTVAPSFIWVAGDGAMIRFP
jgi:hypothetical protein